MAAIDDFIRSIIDPRNDMKNAPAPSLGGFASNVASGLGNTVQGVASIPKAVYTGITQPETVGPGITSLLKGMGNSINKTVGEPVNPQTGALQVPSIAEASRFTYEHPVDVAANLSMAHGVTDMLGGEKGIPKAPNEAPVPEGGLPQIAKKSSIPKEAIADYNSIFEVPRAVANKMKIKPQAVVGQLIEDGITGKTLGELKDIAGNVTGENGAFPQINRIILQDVTTPINYTDATKAVGSSIDSYLKGSPEGLVNTVRNQVTRAFPGYNPTGVDMGTASDLFNTSQELGKLQDFYERRAFDANGNLANPEYERAGMAIADIKNNVSDILDKSVPKDIYQAYKADPRILEQLQRVPPQVANRWIDTAKQFRDGRSIQAPYVNLSKMIEHTEDAQMTAFTKLRQSNTGQPASEILSEKISHPVQTLQSGVQAGVQKVLSPFDKSLEDIQRAKTSGQSATLKPMAQIGNATKTAGTALPAIGLANQEGQPVSPQPNGGTPDTTQKGKDRYTFSSPVSSGMALSQTDYLKQQNDLTGAISQDKATGNYVKLQQDQGALDQLNNKYNVQKPLISKWQDTAVITKLANTAFGLAQSAPPDPSQFSSWIDAIRKGTDKNYNSLTAALNYFHTKLGADFSQIKSKDALIGALDQLVYNTQNEFNTYLESYSGGQVPTNPQGPQQPLPQQPPSNLPPITNQAPISFLGGDAGQMLPIPAP